MLNIAGFVVVDFSLGRAKSQLLEIQKQATGLHYGGRMTSAARRHAMACRYIRDI